MEAIIFLRLEPENYSMSFLPHSINQAVKAQIQENGNRPLILMGGESKNFGPYFKTTSVHSLDVSYFSNLENVFFPLPDSPLKVSSLYSIKLQI